MLQYSLKHSCHIIDKLQNCYPGVENELFSVHIAMSQVATSWQPAAAAKPCTTAMTGTGHCMIPSMSRVQVENTWL
jgi:hypothetical protein